ncbi:4e-binding protein thor [Anaeramoeba flamelloides]|uniref:4e-binding protein thor n=1 Tax=Anaeramoeba flamelloides TaxID=1746091 RepID=A0AAV7Y309_9EUKA|nr:4e-binding protein thor [Anaeramoeba flamelloides]|eukprot:Anaeramoba_flamelloidesa326037_411.p1 GENE.a326037_411~~a326037_411.p1  ORF type:complete len:130 (-),score=27.05 a326037_411:309-656(-)
MTQNNIKKLGIKIPTRGGDLQLPEYLSISEGGTTIFGTTPGGTQVTYSREQLLSYAKSPLSKSPPTGMSFIQGITNNVEEEENEEIKIKKQKSLEIKDNQFLEEEAQETTFFLMD